MSKIVIILLLSTGVYSLLDGDNVEDVSKQEVVNNDESEKVTLSKEVDTQNEETATLPTDDNPKLAKAPKKAKTVGLNKEQVDMLAEKVIRIHGVNLDGDDEENQKNIDKLRRVVANVEKDLNEKLKLSQAKIQTNANPNGKDAVVKEAAASDAVQTQEGNETPVENPESNPLETENLELLKEHTEDGEEKTENDVVDETTNLENEEVERDADQTENESVSEAVETQSETDNDEEVDRPGSTLDETDNINKEEETSDTENNDGVVEANEAEESDVDNTNPEENENEEAAEEDVEEEEAVQNDIGQDVNESSFTESSPENESDNVKNVEDELPGACTLNDGCDETDTIHAYSEEYNTGKIAEQELEDKVEDTHLQRLIKYVTSFF